MDKCHHGEMTVETLNAIGYSDEIILACNMCQYDELEKLRVEVGQRDKLIAYYKDWVAVLNDTLDEEGIKITWPEFEHMGDLYDSVADTQGCPCNQCRIERESVDKERDFRDDAIAAGFDPDE